VRRRIFAVYRRAQRQIRAPRAPSQTVREHAAEHPELADLAQIVEVAAYKPGPPDVGLLARVLAWQRKSRL
jgi:hypothetical protein